MSDYLCDELIFEIFTKLPPKSLLRFRSLSKLWYSCISSPRFTRMHTFRSPQKLLIRHQAYNRRVYDYKDFYTMHSVDQLPLRPRYGYFGITPVEFPYNIYFQIFGSCNGILCLFNYEENGISLSNPLIRRKLTLPSCPRRCYDWSYIGFGFDLITDDYKIVTMFNRGHGGSSYVYAVKTSAWGAIASPTPLFSYVLTEACFVNGALHWVVDCPYIITFDLSTHVFGTIPLLESFWDVRGLAAIQGSLAVYTKRYGDSWIWMRKDVSWFVVHKLNANQVGGCIIRVLTTNGDLLLYTPISRTGQFQVYNATMGSKSKQIHYNVASRIINIVPHVESLHLFDMGLLGVKKRSKNFVFDDLFYYF